MNYKKKAFIDFDGTLIFVYKKYFNIINDFIFTNYLKNIEYDSYIRLKKSGHKDHEIVKLLLGIDIPINNYHIEKLKNLEDPKYLDFDELIPMTMHGLEMLRQKGFYIELLTYRQNRSSLIHQLKKLSLYHMFDKITTLEHNPKMNQKSLYINLEKISNQDIVFGDSPVEIEAANENMILGIFVLTGLYSLDQVPSCVSYDNFFEAVKHLK